MARVNYNLLLIPRLSFYSQNDYTVLHRAVNNNNADLVKMILDRSTVHVDVNNKVSVIKTTTCNNNYYL